MSHTLHRVAGDDGLKDDYIILVMGARGINVDETTGPKYKQYLEIIRKHNPVNMGGMSLGHMYDTESIDQIIANADEKKPMVHGVFATREDLVACLKEIKEADLGLSVIVSGLVDSTKCACKEAGLERHSLNYSFGIWGNTSVLPDDVVLKLSSMCGHAMVSFHIVEKEIEAIKAGKTTPRAAAERLAKPCVCGIFNVARAERLLEEFIQ